MDIIKKGSDGKDVLIKIAHQREIKKEGIRLGRHVEHDPRSRSYSFSAPRSLTLRTVTHPIRIPVLDQMDVGACTGYSALACVAADPFYAKIAKNNAYRPGQNATVDGGIALSVYEKATIIDGIEGVYPPEDTGSTGLAVAKILKSLGLISGYKHAFSLDATLSAIMSVPIIVGVNWYEGFDYPNSKGLVKIGGDIRGGHEFCIYGIDAKKRLVYARNSWGASWGLNGNFSFSIDDLARLLREYGDATIFVPAVNSSKK